MKGLIIGTMLLAQTTAPSQQEPAPAPQQQVHQVLPTAPSPQPRPAIPAASSPRDEVGRLQLQLQVLERQVESLERSNDRFQTFLAIFLGLAAVGSGLTLWWQGRFERRASESHSMAIANERSSESRAAQLHELLIRGEGAAQRRADEVHHSFLEGSKTTLELVNATLSLAKDASERAARSMEEKAERLLHTLDTEAKALLATIRGGEDRALVAEEHQRAELRSLAEKLRGFEINQFYLQKDIPLTPPCLFIRGMAHHLDQQFRDALGYWHEVAFNDSADEFLRSLTWYWIAYEHNNLGEFKQAVTSIDQAIAFGEGDRLWELKRLQVESRFFDGEDPRGLIKTLESFVSELDSRGSLTEELLTRRRKLIITLANFYHAHGETLRRSGDLGEAEKNFGHAARLFEQARQHEQWARFGLAEALYRLERTEEAIVLYTQSVKRDAETASVRRVEPRTKVLNRMTELICYARVPEWQSQFDAMRSQVIEALGEVNPQLTIYSQMRRRNVSRDAIRRDLEEIEKQRKEAAGTVETTSL